MRGFSILLLIMLIPLGSAASDLIHPLDFKGTEAEKTKVVSFIKESVKQTYSEIGMDDALTLRMMEKDELMFFKKLTKVDNRALLDGVISQYCDIADICSYNTIYMMYNEENRASKGELNW